MLDLGFLRAVVGCAEAGAREPVVLMFAEAVAWRCQRLSIADALVVRGMARENIVGPAQTQRHALMPWARAEQIQIMYRLPADNGERETANHSNTPIWTLPTPRKPPGPPTHNPCTVLNVTSMVEMIYGSKKIADIIIDNKV